MPIAPPACYSARMTLEELVGSDWRGSAELWLDPLGNEVQISACTLRIESSAVRYTWAYEGIPHQGTIALDAEGGTFIDTWHSPTVMRCENAARSTGIIDLLGSYAAGDGPRWGWRLLLAVRPPYGGSPESLVLQMTNIAPWGEEARAVRMIATRA